MRIVHLCPLILPLLLALPGSAPASTPELQARMETLARESDALVKQRSKWEGVQKALLKQKQEIDAAQDAILQRQADVNQRGASHNQQAQQQAARLKTTQQDCSNGGNNSSGHANECKNAAAGLNQQTGDINADAEALKAEQDKLDAQYAQANQTASDWNSHEKQAVQQLNTVYKSMNEWLDRMYAVITDGDFRDEVAAQGADAYCENRGLPAGTLSIATMTRLADGYRKCLKYVLAAQSKAAAPAGQ